MNHRLVDRITNLQLDSDFVEEIRDFLKTFMVIMDSRDAFSQDFIYGSNRAPIEKLEVVLGSTGLVKAVDRGIVTEVGEMGYLPFGFIRFGASTYLRESKWLFEHRNLFSITPAHNNDFVRQQIGYLKRLVGNQKSYRLLEMGCGTGLVALELADHVEKCPGVDIYSRNLAFAQANLQLSCKKNVCFLHSDLFSNVDEKHDLIVFYPWAPAEDSLSLVARFLDAAPDALAPGGTIVLITGSDSQAGDLLVFDTVTKACTLHDLRGSREFVASYCMARGSRSIGTISIYKLHRSRSSPPRAEVSPVRTVMTKGYAALLARKTKAAILSRKR